MQKEKNFEEALNNLKEIAYEIEKDDISIDKSIELYKNGIKEAIFCSKYLEQAEQEVYLLKKDLDGLFKLDKFYYMEEDI